MAEQIRMPQKGLTEESAILCFWHVKKGDVVKEGDYLFDIETSKATFSIESEVAGTVLETFGNEGDEILVKSVVCVIGQPGENFETRGQAEAKSLSLSPEQQKPAVTSPAPIGIPSVPALFTNPEAPTVIPSAPTATLAAVFSTVTHGGRLFASRKAKVLASEYGIDLAAVQATGPKGRIIKDDVLRTVPASAQATAGASQPAPALPADVPAAPTSAQLVTPISNEDFTVVKNTSIRKTIARNMHQSLQNMAQLTLHASFDASALIEVKDKLKAKAEASGRGRITINDMIIFAVSRTILGFPALNAHFSDERTVLFHNAHIGVAVDTKSGLMVPTVSNANHLSLRQISETAKSLAKECQEGRATPQMLSGATFTTTNLGALRVESFTPVIAPPQTAILGIGCIDYKAKMINGQIDHYPAIGLSLTFDHRAVDGAPAARFLKALCENMEDFLTLLAE